MNSKQVIEQTILDHEKYGSAERAYALRDALQWLDNLTAVQARCTELIEENRRLQERLLKPFSVGELRRGLDIASTAWVVKVGESYLAEILESKIKFCPAREDALVYTSRKAAVLTAKAIRAEVTIAPVKAVRVVIRGDA